MPNVNVLARPIEGDTIFESMRRSSGIHCSLNSEEVQNNNSFGYKITFKTEYCQQKCFNF